MQHLGLEESSKSASAAEQAAQPKPSPVIDGANRDALLQERELLLAKVQRLEVELERYRSHAQRTSKMFRSVTSYAEWIRENARRDATLVLKKARARAERTLGDVERERDRTERELLRLQALTAETRARLTAFTVAALEVLDAQVAAVHGSASESTLGADLQKALQSELASPSQPAPAEAETLEHTIAPTARETT